MTENVETALVAWSNAVQRLEHLRSDFRSAETDLINARNALGKIMSPKDAVDGETFNVWVSGRPLAVPGDRLLTVTRRNRHDYLVNWRGEPVPRQAEAVEVEA